MKKVLLTILFIFLLAGCSLEKKVLSENDKSTIYEKLRNYDLVDEYQENSILLTYTEGENKSCYEYKINIIDDNSIIIKYKDPKSPGTNIYEFDNDNVKIKNLNSSNVETIIKDEDLNKSEFLYKYASNNCSKYNLNLKDAEYYRIEFSGYLAQKPIWANYFTFDSDYVYKFTLYDNVWEIKNVKVKIETKPNDFSFDTVIISGIDKGGRNFTISITVEKE